MLPLTVRLWGDPRRWQLHVLMRPGLGGNPGLQAPFVNLNLRFAFDGHI
jgi:hypothetical protein